MLWDMEPGAVGPRPSGPPSLTLPEFEPISLTERGVEGGDGDGDANDGGGGAGGDVRVEEGGCCGGFLVVDNWG